MRRELKAAAVAAAVAVATAAFALARFTTSAPESPDGNGAGHEVLEMLFCLPVANCAAKKRAASFNSTVSSGTCAYCGKEAI